MSKLIVIDGLDGSGKHTQAVLLADKLKKESYQTQLLSFPAYESNSSALVKMYLQGNFGTDPLDVNCYAASAFYAVDRIANFLETWKKTYETTDTIFIADRYTTSNIIYQAIKLTDLTEKKEYNQWITDFEYNKLGLPKPDMVVYLDVDPDVSQKLMDKRYGNDATKKDIHESNITFLRNCRISALETAIMQNWYVIKCTSNKQIRNLNDISDDIYNTIQPVIANNAPNEITA